MNKVIASWLLLCLAASCKQKQTLFTRLDPSVSGIHFNNTITENDSVNLIADEYAYMGSGIGIGDFNKDGLPDLFFGGNQTSSRLYLNLGNHQFRDITKTAGVETTSWCTGVSVVDINNDGWPDIYVCVSGNAPGRHNLLFINNHDLTFTERSAEYGLADTGYCTQAAFFDYDGDGLLDMYLVRHELHPSVSQNDIVKHDTSGSSIRSDKLYKNMGALAGSGHPYFKDVSLSAGIRDDGYGLGVAVSDFNGDGWPDVYVTNDYLSNDLLWLNNRNGTFTNVIAESLGHQSYSSMGVDAADVNNDGLPDIATLDMMPGDNYRKKMMYSFMSYERYELERRAGYQPEFMRNMLQLNRGVWPAPAALPLPPDLSAAGPVRHSAFVAPSGFRPFPSDHSRPPALGARPTSARPVSAIPYFSEIGQLAGIAETDWSWSILLADFDNDGYKDITITNGEGRDLINADFINYRVATYGRIDKKTRDALLRKQLDSMGKIALRKYYFHNNGDGTFSNQSQLSGIDEKAISNGAAYVDLDNDGDLDLVVNNIDQEASIYINNSREFAPTPTSQPAMRAPFHYVSFVLHGDSLNRDGIGTKIFLWQNGAVQTVEQYPVRGYASSVDPRPHFGLGANGRVDSVTVIWPRGRTQRLQHIAIDTTLTLTEPEPKAAAEPKPKPNSEPEPKAAAKPKAKPNTEPRPNTEPEPKAAAEPNTASPAEPAISAPTTAAQAEPASPPAPAAAETAGAPAAAPEANTAAPHAPSTNPGSPTQWSTATAGAFRDITDSLHVNFKHQETFFNDFAFNSLLPQKFSQAGPFISTGDLDGDGRMDFFIGGAFNESGEVWLQQPGGSFIGKPLVSGVKHQEDMQSILVDVDGDHDLDLIVASGSSEFGKGSPFLMPRLYLNDGKGNFALSPDAFPASVNTIAQTISFTGGRPAPGEGSIPGGSHAAPRAAAPLRIFIGGRVSLDYPYSPKSFLLEYRNGAFVDITAETCPALSEAGMITSSLWADLDGDGENELIIAGDWMPVRIFKTENGQLKELTDAAGLSNDLGLWKSLAVADVDGDGDLDIIAGNLGTNNPYHVSAETPMRLIAKDFQGNGRITPLLCYYIPDETGKKTLQPGMDLNHLSRQEPSFKDRFPTNTDFAKAGLAQILPAEATKDALTLNCNELHTCWFENLGGGKFRKHLLPLEAQFAPVNAILARDLDGDGKMDLVLAGNEYQAEVIGGRYDASYGLLLKGTGHGNFAPVPHGIFIKGDVRDIKSIKNGKGGDLILVGINDQAMRILTRR